MSRFALLALACLGTLTACSSPPGRLYTLSAPEPPASAASPALHVALGPVTIPAGVDRPQLVVRQSAVRVAALEQERWAEPLREGVPRVLADALRSRLHEASVSTLAMAASPPDLHLAVDITRYEAIAGSEVIIAAHWRLRSADAKTTREGSTVARQVVRGGAQDYEAVVAAEAAALADIGAELARAIEQEVSAK
jgi:uncharacterized protein